MVFEEIFNELKQLFINADVSNIKQLLTFQFNIVGEGAGVFYAEVKNGKLSIEPYEYLDRQVVFTATAKVFKDIATGKLNPIKAYVSKKLKVQGDINKAMELQKLINN